jgi:hypothetical protein
MFVQRHVMLSLFWQLKAQDSATSRTTSHTCLRLIERLLTILPPPSLSSFFFTNLGSEVVETAFKMARNITRKQNIITMQRVPRVHIAQVVPFDVPAPAASFHFDSPDLSPTTPTY